MQSLYSTLGVTAALMLFGFSSAAAEAAKRPVRVITREIPPGSHLNFKDSVRFTRPIGANSIITVQRGGIEFDAPLRDGVSVNLLCNLPAEKKGKPVKQNMPVDIEGGQVDGGTLAMTFYPCDGIHIRAKAGDNVTLNSANAVEAQDFGSGASVTVVTRLTAGTFGPAARITTGVFSAFRVGDGAQIHATLDVDIPHVGSNVAITSGTNEKLGEVGKNLSAVAGQSIDIGQLDEGASLQAPKSVSCGWRSVSPRFILSRGIVKCP